MNKYAIILASLIVFLGNTSLKSQTRDTTKVFYYKGRIINEKDKPLVFAHVINLRRGYATITDSTGWFRMPVVYKDSIRVSSIGYHTRIMQVKQKSAGDSLNFHKIRLISRAYDLPTVDIYELRWQVFKSEFMEKEIKEDKVAKKVSNWMSNLIPSDELRMMFQSGRGVGFSLNFKSKSEKQRRKVNALEKKYSIIAPKFNDEMIKSLTGLKGKAIYPFLKFCNFSEAFLMHATEYEIMERVLVYWEEYKQRGLHEGKR